MVVTWITFADGEKIAIAAGLPYDEVGASIFAWIDRGQIATRALGITRIVDRPLDAAPLGDPDENGVYPIGMPLASSELPTEKHGEDGRDLSPDEWAEVAACGWDQSTLWTISEMSAPVRGSRSPNAKIIYEGVRISAEDLRRRIEVAGLSSSPPIGRKPTPHPKTEMQNLSSGRPRIVEDIQWLIEQAFPDKSSWPSLRWKDVAQALAPSFAGKPMPSESSIKRALGQKK